MLRRFLWGITSVFRSVGLILRNDELRRRSLLPLLINVVCVGLGVPLLTWLFWPVVKDWIPNTGPLDFILRIFFTVLGVALTVLASFFVAITVAKAIAGPMCTRLSRAAEKELKLRAGLGYTEDTLPFVKDAFQNILLTIAMMGMFFVCYLPILALQLIPVAGQALFLVFSLLYGAFTFSLNFGDYVFERHFKRLRDKVRFILAHKAIFLGYGLAAFGLMLIPFVNVIMLPVCVVAVTIVYMDIERYQQPAPETGGQVTASARISPDKS